METMSYNKINKKRKNYGVYGFFTFVILGTGLVVYSLINEPEPTVLGKDPLKEVNVKKASSENVVNAEDISYEITDSNINEKEGNFKTNITIPVVKVDSEELTEINKQIYETYAQRAATLKKEMSSTENKFTFKVTYNKYENIIEGKKVVSITVHERIVDDAAGSTTTDKIDTYNVDLVDKKILSQDEAAVDVLGSNYVNLIKNQVKSTLIGSKMVKEESYSYTITGLEQFYVKEGEFHIILNEGQVVDKSYGVVDIAITK